MSKLITLGESSADKYITTVYYLAGLWFPEKQSLLYRIHSFVLLALLFLWVLCLDIGLVLSENLSKATLALCTTLPVTVCYAKTMNLYVNNKTIQSCLQRVHNFRLNDVEEKEFARNQLSIFFKFTVFYAMICNLTISFVCWRVTLLDEPELPFPAWYPLDWQHSNRDFWIVQSLQFYGMLIAVNINLTCELFPCFFLTVIGCQLEILGMRLEKLNREFPEDGKRKSKVVENLINEHVETHNYIVNLTEDIQKSYDFQFFVEMCTVSLSNTANAFQISLLVAQSKLGDHDIPLYTHFITYIMCNVSRIFLPCYFGNLVLSASEALRIRLYSSDWLNMTIVCRKKVITLMERMKRRTVIWAWILFPLTLEMFKSILNFSYTMLTLLQNLN